MATDLEKQKATGARYRARNRDRIRAVKKAAYDADPKAHQERSKRYRRENAEKVRPKWNEYQRRRRTELRAAMIEAYGSKCACCGESETHFLQLDHVNGGGREHRRQFNGLSTEMYAALRKQGWPADDYRLLCANCNWGRARNGGVCPHQLQGR